MIGWTPFNRDSLLLGTRDFFRAAILLTNSEEAEFKAVAFDFEGFNGVSDYKNNFYNHFYVWNCEFGFIMTLTPLCFYGALPILFFIAFNAS